MTDSSQVTDDAVVAGPDAVARGDAAARVRAVRSFLRQREAAPSVREIVGKLAYQVYVVVLFGGIYGTVTFRALTDSNTPRPELPAAAATAVPAVVMGLAVLATVVGVRVGTWAGPVLVSRAEAAWLLPAPLDRRRLLRRDLGWGLAGYGIAGALIGALVGTIVAVETRVGAVGALLGSIVAWGALGVVTGAVALAVESSDRLARGVLRTTAFIVLAGAGIVWLADAAPEVAVWVTPWGWATAPVAVATGVEIALSWLPPVLLVVAALVASRWAVRRLDAIPDEELVRRAGTAEGVRASAAVFDARAIAQARRSGQRYLVGHRQVRLPRPRRRLFLIVWRDAVSLLRRRGLLERTVAAVAAAAALLWWARGGAAAAVGAVVLVSSAAGQLLEPLRIELEEPVIGELSPLTPTDVSLEHLIVPVLLLTLCGWLVGILAAVATILPWSALPAVMIASVGAAVLFTGIAGLTSTRGAPPLQWLTTGDYGALLLVGWLLAGPLLALILVLPGVLIVVGMLHDGTDPAVAVVQPSVIALFLTAGLAGTMRWRARVRTEGSWLDGKFG